MFNLHSLVTTFKALQLLLVGSTLINSISCLQPPFWNEASQPGGHRPGHGQQLPDSVSFNQPGLYPEGVAYDPIGKRFLVSSFTTGTIGAVSDQGTYTPFIQDSSLISTIGLRVDPWRKRLLVAIGDIGLSQKSTPQTTNQFGALGIFDLTSGKKIALVDLAKLRPGNRHAINDVAVDPYGNVYATDSFSPIIYKVDENGKASVFVENDIFAVNPNEFGLNGIVYHPEGYLIVASSKTNKLYKVPVRKRQSVEEIKLDVVPEGLDGLLLSKDGRQLVVVGNTGGQAPGRVYTYATPNRWSSASVVNRFVTSGIVFPTTATSRAGQVYVLYSYLNQLFGGVQPSASTFTIRRVPQANAHVAF